MCFVVEQAERKRTKTTKEPTPNPSRREGSLISLTMGRNSLLMMDAIIGDNGIFR